MLTLYPVTLLNSRIFEAFPFALPFLDFLFPYPVTLAAPNSDLLTPHPRTVAFCLNFICNDRGLTVPRKEKLDKCGPHSVWLLRLGAEEGEPHVLLRKREWTIGRRRGAGRRAGMGNVGRAGDKPGDGSGHGGGGPGTREGGGGRGPKDRSRGLRAETW